MFLGWAVQSSTEEIIFRGWVLPVVGTRYRPWLGVAASSFLFWGLHLFNGAFVPIALVNWLLMGVLLTFYALWDESIWGACAFHASWNWATSHVFNIDPGVGPAGTLLNFHDNQLNNMFAGELGPDFMFVQAAVLLVTITAMLIAAKRKAPRLRAATGASEQQA